MAPCEKKGSNNKNINGEGEYINVLTGGPTGDRINGSL